MSDRVSHHQIGIVGIACWYPGSRNPRQLWENILARRRQFRPMPDCRLPSKDYFDPNDAIPDVTYGRLAAVIDGFDFDRSARKVPQPTFDATDITHWLALEVALEAIKDAGFAKESLPNEKTGVIIGNSLTGEFTRSYTLRTRWPFVRRVLRQALEARGLSKLQIAEIEPVMEGIFKSPFPPVGPDSLAGGLSNTIAGRICNYLNLHGGGYTVDGACSSSLLAVATGANALMQGDLDLAIVGGVDISLDPFELVGFAKTHALTKSDMRVYDRGGAGFIPGEGCGFVILQRQEDARAQGRYVYATLNGWGIASDGGGTGLTAPVPAGQARALRRAYARAGYDMDRLSFIEGHGTGTNVGDRVELEGIALAMEAAGTLKNRSCGLTSVKSIIGHAKAAAGVAGFLKAVVAVNRRVLPPTANCREPNPAFDQPPRALYPIMTGRELPRHQEVFAGVSAMGFGGINCHVTLSSADAPRANLEPAIEERALMASAQETEVFLFAAESQQALAKSISELRHLASGASLAELIDMAARQNSSLDRRAPLRAAVVATRPEDLIEKLEALQALTSEPLVDGQLRVDTRSELWAGHNVSKTRLGMLFPGQGSQKLNMAAIIPERFPWARDWVSNATKMTTSRGGPHLAELIFRPLELAPDAKQVEEWTTTLAQTENAQPAICLASVLWLEYLNRLGIAPSAVGGHSLGELTAFHAAGGYSFDQLMLLATARGQGMAAKSEDAGGMAILRCSQEEAERVLSKTNGYCVLANINGPKQVVISGEREALEEAIRIATDMGVHATRLKSVSNAFHSRLMSRAASELHQDETLEPTLGPLSVKLFSSIDGKERLPGSPLRAHFGQQVLAKVDFVSLVVAMSQECDLVLEVGPGSVLSSLAREISGARGPLFLPVESTPGRDQDLNTVIAALFTHGFDFRWDDLYENRLVRHDFVPASKRLFVQNPCERPLSLEVTSRHGAEPASMGKFEAVLREALHLADSDFADYVEERGEFLAELVAADLKHLRRLPPSPIPFFPQPKPPPPTPAPSPTTPPFIVPSQKSTREEVESYVIDVVVHHTGFRRDTISSSSRLLDDLSLDSLRSGDLVSVIATSMGLGGALEPISLGNATIAELVDRLMVLVSEPSPVPPPLPSPSPSISPDEKSRRVLSLVLEHAARITGFKLEALDPDAELERDLHMGRELVYALVMSATEALQVSANVDLDPLMKRSLRQLAAVLERLNTDHEVRHSLKTLTTSAWVRPFEIRAVEEKRAPLPKSWGQRKEDDWQTSTVLLLSSTSSQEAADAVRQALFLSGAQVVATSYEDARSRGLMHDPAFSHLIAVLPQGGSDGVPTEEDVRAALMRLSAIACPPPANRKPRRRVTIAYIQFGGGHLCLRGPAPHLLRASASAFAASLHLERQEDLRVRVLDFSPSVELDKMAEMALAEINTPAPYAAVAFDLNLVRRISKAFLLRPSTFPRVTPPLGPQDVILAIGGARGITPHCALGLAKATGARIVLVGRSLPPEQQPDPLLRQELERTLRSFSDRGLPVRYESCDINNREALQALVNRIDATLGPITAVIQGAGLNLPRRTSDVSLEEAMTEVRPKVLGSLNLLSVLQGRPLKLLVGLTSIIGVTGMARNAFYAYSNEALDLLLARYEADHPTTHVVSMAFSAWAEEGMAVRLRSIDFLAQLGVEPISTEDGVRQFVHLCLHAPGCRQVVVTGRVGGLDTWSPERLPEPTHARFLEQLIHSTPGVESVFRVHLDPGEDLYLRDHRFEGALLLPAVFGLEAMVQGAAHAAGKSSLEHVCIEGLELKRKLKVDPQRGLDLLIRAVVDSPLSASAEDAHVDEWVTASLLTEDRETEWVHFSARIGLGYAVPVPNVQRSVPATPLSLSPAEDLYRPNFLWQGPLFHRITRVHRFVSPGEHAEGALFSSRLEGSAQAGELAFASPSKRELYFGDPFFRDSLLQSCLLILPRLTALPLGIRRLERFASESFPVEAVVEVTLIKMDDRLIEVEVTATTPDGRLLERMTGYTVAILQQHPERASVSDLLDPSSRDTQALRQALGAAAERLRVQLPSLELRYLGNLHRMETPVRHALERTELLRMVSQRQSTNDEKSDIQWLETGQPVVTGTPKSALYVSLSHDDQACLFTLGAFAQGCDMAPIEPRSRQAWLNLLGARFETPLDRLLDRPDSLDRAGIRIWAVLEAERKLMGNIEVVPCIEAEDGDAVLFSITSLERRGLVLSLPLQLTWGPPRMFALAVSQDKEGQESVPKDLLCAYDFVRARPHLELLLNGGPQGQPMMVQRFTVTFKPASSLSRRVQYPMYPFWAGEIRENSAFPVLEQMGREFSSGRTCVVTNHMAISFVGEASAADLIEARMWASANGGRKNSSMDLAFEFRRCLPSGDYERIATAELRTTWAKVVAPGKVELEEYPDFYWEFAREMIPKGGTPSGLEPLPEPLAALRDQETPIFQATSGPHQCPPLFEYEIQTTLDHGNLVGNVYFAWYHSWQAQTRDLFFHSLVPEYFVGAGSKGEIQVLSARVDHLQEALPFDRVVVTMLLRSYRTSSMRLSFEYHRIEGDEKRVKLATGEQEIAWIRRDDRGTPHLAPLPIAVIHTLEAAITAFEEKRLELG